MGYFEISLVPVRGRSCFHRNKNLSASGTQITPMTIATNQIKVRYFANDQLGIGAKCKKVASTAMITTNETTATMTCKLFFGDKPKASFVK